MHPVALPAFLDSDYLLTTFGLIGLLVIIFAECGLLIGFFLPGDTLLFTGGVLVATDRLHVQLWILLVLVSVAGIAGNLVGYWIGFKAGPAVFSRPDSRLFRREYVDKSAAFFDRYGAATIVLARFVPVVRTFATVMAGASRMPVRTYVGYSVVGGVLWAAGVTTLGYFLGTVPFIADNVEAILVIGVVAVAVVAAVPILIRFRNSRRARRARGASAELSPAQEPADC